jgi:hypothetical protein
MPAIARVVEIIQLVGSAADHRGAPDGVLIQDVEVIGMSQRLRMPLCDAARQLEIHPISGAQDHYKFSAVKLIII